MSLNLPKSIQPECGLLTYDQAAKVLGVTSRWLEDQVQGGAVPHRRLGRLVRFAPDDLAEIVAQAKRGGEVRR